MEATLKNYEILNKIESLKAIIQIDIPTKASWNIGEILENSNLL